jgi:DNA-binding response OmpR family regulator
MMQRNSNGKTDILLVAENPTETAAVIKVLKKARIINRLHVLADGAEILDFLFRTGRYQQTPSLPTETLILLSLNLQGGNGVDVLRRIKGDQRSRDFPVIMLASSQDDRGVMEGYKMGANACIVQPIDITKFIEAVAELRLGWLLITESQSEP